MNNINLNKDGNVIFNFGYDNTLILSSHNLNDIEKSFIEAINQNAKNVTINENGATYFVNMANINYIKLESECD